MTNELKNFLEGDFIGNNVHSVYTHCLSCGAWGINLPLDKICGNCNKDTDTYTYYDKETVVLHDTRLINFVLQLVENEVEKEKSKEYQCEVHNKPRGITASNYDCTDIHIGRAEALSDISTIINNLRV